MTRGLRVARARLLEPFITMVVGIAGFYRLNFIRRAATDVSFVVRRNL